MFPKYVTLNCRPCLLESQLVQQIALIKVSAPICVKCKIEQ